MADELKDAMENTLSGATPDILKDVEGVPAGPPTEEPVQAEEPSVPAEDATLPTEPPPPVEPPEAVTSTLKKYGNDPNKLAEAYNALTGRLNESQRELNQVKPFQSYLDDLQNDPKLQQKVYEHYAARGQAPAQPEHPAPATVPPATAQSVGAFMPEGESFDPYDMASDPNSSSAKALQAFLTAQQQEALNQRDRAAAQRQKTKDAATRYEGEKQKLIRDHPEIAQEWADFEQWAASPNQVKLDNLYKLYKQKETLQKVETDARAKVLAELNANAGRVPSVATVASEAEVETKVSEEQAFAKDLTKVGNAGTLPF